MVWLQAAGQAVVLKLVILPLAEAVQLLRWWLRSGSVITA